MMRNDPAWYVGIGRASTDTEADKIAISDLLTQISVQVSSTTEVAALEIDGSAHDYWKNALKTYSNAQLEGLDRRVYEDAATNRSIVYRFVKREDCRKLFRDRERMLKAYVDLGREAELSVRIGDALQYYYWALLLLRTHPEVNRISHTIDGREQVLLAWLPARLELLFAGLRFRINNPLYCQMDKLTRFELYVTYDQSPVRNLDFSYYLGNDWYGPVTVRDGYASIAFFTIPEQVPKPVRINVVYDYERKASVNQELVRVREDVSKQYFEKSRFNVYADVVAPASVFTPEVEVKADFLVQTSKTSLGMAAKDEPGIHTPESLPNERATADVVTQVSAAAPEETPSKIDTPKALDVNELKRRAATLSTLIQNKDYSALEQLCTPQGIEYVQKLLKYGNARPSRQKYEITCTQMGESLVLRGIPIQFNFPRSGRSFNETLTIHYDKSGRIDRINMGLSDLAIQDIMGGVVASEAEKQRIVCFIEDYKTAYCLKDISFVERVFSENALIIVGSMLKEDPARPDNMHKSLGKNWRPNTYSKAQYIENLRKVFASNEFVNLSLEDNTLSRHNDPNSKIFGIQIRQNYYSQNYADQGYLFLMFDLENVNKPKIYVRTWQPEKNPDGSIYGLKDFYLGKN